MKSSHHFFTNDRQNQTTLGFFRKGTDVEKLLKRCNCCAVCNCIVPALQVLFGVLIPCLKTKKKEERWKRNTGGQKGSSKAGNHIPGLG